jgi:hypothetical protein
MLLTSQTEAQSPTVVSADALVELVRGRTIALSFYGDPTNPVMTSIWDFRANGSLCARIIGANRKDKCADEGTWKIDGAVLCWELPTLGRSLGINPACSTVLKVKADRFEFRNQKTPDLTFGTFMVLGR